MNNKKITPGFVLTAISTVLAIVCCFLYKSVVQQSSTTYTLLIFAAIFVVIGVYCRCPHCGRAIYLGLWQKTVCPHCRRHLSSGKKVRGSRS